MKRCEEKMGICLLCASLSSLAPSLLTSATQTSGYSLESLASRGEVAV
jgi:hypothetical protein